MRARDDSPEVAAGFDFASGRVDFVARNLSEVNFRWVIAGLGGGALAIWLLKEIADFVLALIELQLKYG